MRPLPLLALTLLSACVVQPSPSPLKPGTGVELQAGTVSVDEGKVPVLPSCADGQLVAKTQNGWECVTPAQAAILKAGDGIVVESNTISAKFGLGHTDVATGDHNHDARYRGVSDHIAWGDVTATGTDVWPGSIPYARVTNAPQVSWQTIEPGVKSTDTWPGTVAYSQVSGAPQVNWLTVSGTVAASTQWPGVMDYSQLLHAPSIPTQYTDAQAEAAVTWNSVKGSVGSSDVWIGKVDYSHLTNTPAAASWTSIRPGVQATDAWPA